VKNVGKTDRIIRLVVGVILLAMIFFLESNWRFLGLIGLIPLYTGLSGSCLLYKFLGINTCPRE
jgi:hypothetical protein